MKHRIIAALAALALCACTPQLDSSGNPVPQAGASSFLAPFAGSLAGSVVGNALSQRSPAAAPSTHTSTHTTIIREVPRPAVGLKPPAYSYRPAATTSFRSYSSGRR